MEKEEILRNLAEAVDNLDEEAGERLAREALDAGISPYQIIADGLSKGMQVVGAKFKAAEVYLPEVLVACDVYYAGLKIVRPHIKPGDRDQFLGTMIIGTIHGDVHTVGKDVAIPVFEAAGFNVIDLGAPVADETFIEAIKEHQPQLVGLGTYMTSTFMHTKETVKKITEAGLRERVKIICGGPSVTPEAARRLGADDASDNAWEAVEKMKTLLAELGES
jgi:methanogenic corrinoid protein MtbC1